MGREKEKLNRGIGIAFWNMAGLRSKNRDFGKA